MSTECQAVKLLLKKFYEMIPINHDSETVIQKFQTFKD